MLKKQEIRNICDNNPKMEWWAMILFAEISELAEHMEWAEDDDKTFRKLITNKIKEFERIVVKEAGEKQIDKIELLEQRVKNVENKIESLEKFGIDLQKKLILVSSNF